MSLEINTNSVEKLVQMVRDFAGNFEYVDANERVLFSNNFIDALYECELESNDNINTFNTFIEHIVNYEISLMDIFDILGTSEIPDLITVAAAFNSSYDSGVLSADSSLETFELYGSDKTVLDILKLANLPEFTRNEIYVSPVIEYGFGTDSADSYNNMLNALRDFYNNGNLSATIQATPTISSGNDELTNFVEYLKQSYLDKNFLLLQYGGNRPKLDILNFILSFKYTDGDELSAVFTNNITIKSAKEASNKLYSKCIKYYLADISTYINRNKQFVLSDYLIPTNIITDGNKDVTISNLPYNMFLGLIYNVDTFTDYFKDLVAVRDYILDIQSAIKTEFGNKFILGV